MKEQSHIEEMRAAVRGDIERADRRRLGEDSRPATALAVPTAPAEKRGLGARVAALFRRA